MRCSTSSQPDKNHVYVRACVCVCVLEGLDERGRERRMSTESCEEFTTHHRYDSDSSTHTGYNSMIPPTKIFKRALSQHLRSGVDDSEHVSAGSLFTQRHSEHVSAGSLFTEAHSALTEADVKSNDAQDGGGEVAEGLLVSVEGGTSEVVADAAAVAGGHSRSVIRRCVDCGCERLSTVASLTTNVYTSNEVAAAGWTQGSADTRQSSDGGQNTGEQGRRGGHSVSQGKVRSHVLSDGGHNVSATRRVGVIEVNSYSGTVSRQLCQQLVQLLTELDTARHVNTQVSLIN